MAIQPLKRQIILEATSHLFENQAVLNPAAYAENGLVHLFYRAVRTGNHSSIGYAILKDGQVIWRSPRPVLFPETAPERQGIEDPRIVKLKDRFYLFYTVYDGADAQVAYATADTLPHFRKQRIISPPITYGEVRALCRKSNPTPYVCRCIDPIQDDDTFLWDKDAFIFPEYIHGRIVLMHRLKPEIQLSSFTSFDELGRHRWWHYLENLETHTLLKGTHWFESGYIGGGAPPVRTPDGWLVIYHGVEHTARGYIYRAGALLLDLEQPQKIRSQLPYPLFEPTTSWERNGDVNNVVFPTAAIVHDDIVDIYYGAADKRIGLISFSLHELLRELHKSPYRRHHA